jgi:hypothetical protein
MWHKAAALIDDPVGAVNFPLTALVNPGHDASPAKKHNHRHAVGSPITRFLRARRGELSSLTS